MKRKFKNRNQIIRKCIVTVLSLSLLFMNIPQQEILANETDDENIVIMLDPGHDDTHAGTQNGNLGEEDIVYKIAKYCKEELEKYAGITVYMTRDTYSCANGGNAINTIDCNIKRVENAASVGADVLVSFHLNASRSSKVSGVGVYYPNSNYRPELGAEGKKLANLLLTNLKNLGISQWSEGAMIRNSEDNTRYPDGSLADYLGMIRMSKEADIMAVLIEHAFLSNASDVANFLNTDEKLKALGVADAKAIIEYYGLTHGAEYAYGDAMISISKKRENTVFTVSADGIENAYGVSFVVWSEDGGQDDLVWYSANKQDDGTWTADISKEYHTSTGVYNIETYINRYDGSYYVVDSTTKDVADVVPSINSWVQTDGKWYCMNESGVILTGWATENGVWYYMDESGAMQTGWVDDGDIWFYMDESGAMLTGWVNDGDAWYYMDGSGAMQTGWINDNGIWYYMNKNGAMLTGWVNDGDIWYYLNESGVMLTGWVNDGGTWYYMDGSGAMQTGWVNDNGTWYYMNQGGAMQTGWVDDNGIRYYMDESGAMQTGWVNDNGTWYYMNSNGEMATSTWIGNDYVDESGAWVS